MALYVKKGKKKAFQINRSLFISSLILSVLLIFYLFANAFSELKVMNILVITIFFICMFTAIKQKEYGTLFFYITYFIFLLSTVFFGIFNSDYKYQFFDSGSESFTLNCLLLGILGVFVGTSMNTKITLSSNKGKSSKRIPQCSKKMKKFLKFSFILTVQCSLLEALIKAIYVGENSYLSYYSDFQTPLPYFVQWLSQISSILFYFYLGTIPSKKEAKIPIFLYLLVGIIALFYGQRNVIVVRTLIILCYSMFRNNSKGKDETWISKKQFIVIISLIPAVIIFMSFWNSFRFGNQYESKGIIDSVIGGLLEQGNSISILDYEYTLGDLLPEKPYAIGGIIGVLSNNIISRILGIPSVPSQQNTIEMAVYGYSYSGALMYIQNRNGYLMGFGIGSSYLAELFDTFGFPGIFFGSMLYGIVLKKLTNFKLKGFILNGFALAMFQQLLLAPRASYDGFISSTFQVSYLFCAFICWLLNIYVWPGDSNE